MAKKIKIENSVKKSIQKNNYNSKTKKNKALKYLAIVLSIILLISITIIITLLVTNKLEKKKENNRKSDSTINESINLEDLVPEDCVFVVTNDVKKIEIAAESSAGVGDVFSKAISKTKYIIKDNKIGDVFTVNYKYNGDESRYECNEDWYSVTLSDGTEGFIWGGYKSMYVNIVE